MTKRIKKRFKNLASDIQVFIVKCFHIEETEWLVGSGDVGNDGYPIIDFCKECCLLKCGYKCTVHKI
jgi:hypothetical protein